MKRRDLLKALKALPVLPVFLGGRLAAASTEIEPKKRVIVFVNAEVLAPDLVAKLTLPKEFIAIYPIRIPEGKTFEDAIRVYEIEPH